MPGNPKQKLKKANEALHDAIGRILADDEIPVTDRTSVGCLANDLFSYLQQVLDRLGIE